MKKKKLLRRPYWVVTVTLWMMDCDGPADRGPPRHSALSSCRIFLTVATPAAVVYVLLLALVVKIVFFIPLTSSSWPVQRLLSTPFWCYIKFVLSSPRALRLFLNSNVDRWKYMYFGKFPIEQNLFSSNAVNLIWKIVLFLIKTRAWEKNAVKCIDLINSFIRNLETFLAH